MDAAARERIGATGLRLKRSGLFAGGACELEVADSDGDPLESTALADAGVAFCEDYKQGWAPADVMRELQARRGYSEVSTPIIVSERLWRQSGHWDLYRDNMFLVPEENETFSLKPMNCPESTFIYRSRVRSYRELPLRLAEYGVLHRNELSGVLSGLTRVRHFVTDDAHIFVREDQIGEEVERVLRLVQRVYGDFGLKPEMKLSTRPPEFLGTV